MLVIVIQSNQDKSNQATFHHGENEGIMWYIYIQWLGGKKAEITK